VAGALAHLLLDLPIEKVELLAPNLLLNNFAVEGLHLCKDVRTFLRLAGVFGELAHGSGVAWGARLWALGAGVFRAVRDMSISVLTARTREQG
jgi:hypothetical protein